MKKKWRCEVPTLGSLFALGWRPAPQIAELLALEVLTDGEGLLSQDEQ